MKTGALNFIPILAAYILLCLAALALTIAAVIVYLLAAILISVVFGALRPVLDPSALGFLSFLVVLAMFAAIYVFNVFYTGLFFAFPAVVYRRLSPDASKDSAGPEMRVQSPE